MRIFVTLVTVLFCLTMSALARENAATLVSKMTLEEKATLLSGDGWWQTHAIERLGIPSIYLTDGPNGLRKSQGAGLNTSVPATCFPTASALAATWNPGLLEEVGAAIGRESQANDVQVLLGPGINMKRSPLGGRNFEYFSEDPVLAGKLAASYINGVQSQGVGTSLKHFAANNQEFERMAVSSDVDERTLHEIYLRAFEIAVKEAQPWTVMCAYNKINGVYASQDKGLLQDVLRDRWGFKGFVVADWGAVDNRVQGVDAGLNLEMPGSGDFNRRKIVAAVEDGTLSKARLDELTTQLVEVVLRAKDARQENATFDKERHHGLARRAAGEGIVLLKNERRLLPLDFKRDKKIALIGAFAKTPRFQGAGSSQVNPTRVANAYDELAALAGPRAQLSFARGYDTGVTDARLIKDAQAKAKAADVAIVFAGLNDRDESEGSDRASLDLPDGHSRLIAAVRKVQPRVIVVLMNGSAVAMPWLSSVPAVLEGWLTGQAGGGALADVLTGRVNPSGKLAETFPVRLADTPAREFPARNQHAVYSEGLFIGYRSYDRRKIAPLFPFGFGLSYTTFAFRGLSVSRVGATVAVSLKVRNTGRVAGKEVVQLYVRDRQPPVVRPDRELKAFAKVSLEPGEEKLVSFSLGERDFAFYDVSRHDWVAHPGSYEIAVGSSSRELPLRGTVELPRVEHPAILTRDSMIKEFRDHPRGRKFYSELLQVLKFDAPAKRELSELEKAEQKKADASLVAFLNDMPVNKLLNFSEGRFTEKRLAEILKQAQD